MKIKLICVAALVFCVTIFTSCSRNNSSGASQSAVNSGAVSRDSAQGERIAAQSYIENEYEGGPGDDYEALPVGFGYLYGSILDGDLDEWAGIWANSMGEKIQLRADGTLNTGQTAYGFTRGAEKGSPFIANGTNYEWIVNMGGEAGGFEVWLFPVGVDIKNYNGDIVQTDKTKDRIFVEYIGSGSDVFYLDGKTHAAQTQDKEQQFVYNVYFNGGTIPITVFYSVTTGDEVMMILNRLVFMYGYIQHTINLPSRKIWESSPNDIFSQYIKTGDYNFDSFPDFAVYDGPSSNWESDIMYKVFVYNQLTENYSQNADLSALPNIRINNETQTIVSNDGPVISEYKWINDRPELIESVSHFYSGPQ